ncbi:MAG: hypothetical protein M1827_002967 [Pycnora praestabilis]|nr:MAG: hypothetical protein M1827_002967 [Pycnora praestabilis]
MATSTMELQEKDEAGNVTATYVESADPNANGDSRIDVIDSLQAFSSAIAGLLSSRAVLEGQTSSWVGVGDASASPTAALLLSVLQESMGRIATILFAHRLGTSLEPECKSYRLAADVFNDTAMILDCLSPAFPKVVRVVLLSLSSVLRALCGVAAGSSKASLSAHFARWGNLGELNARMVIEIPYAFYAADNPSTSSEATDCADLHEDQYLPSRGLGLGTPAHKDSSQETIISLMGMLVGSLVVSRVSSPLATWSSLILLLSIHLATNHAAVRAVSMHTLNRQRANLAFSALIEKDIVPSPDEVAKQERVFERDGVLRWEGSRVLGYCQIGVDLRTMLKSLGTSESSTGSVRAPAIKLADLMDLYRDEEYLLWYATSQKKVIIVLKERASTIAQLKAWVHGLVAARRQSEWRSSEVQARPEPERTMELLSSTLHDLSEHFDGYVQRLQAVGWDLDVAALETLSGKRILV